MMARLISEPKDAMDSGSSANQIHRAASKLTAVKTTSS